MSDELSKLLLDSLERLLDDHCTPERVQSAEDGGFDAALWQQICELELQRAALPEEQGGMAADLPLMTEMVQLAASYALPAPVAEAMVLGPWLVGLASCELPDGLVTVAASGESLRLAISGDQITVDGTLNRVPAGRFADRVLTVVKTGEQEYLLKLTAEQWQLEPAKNLAGEARDQLKFSGLNLSAGDCSQVPAGTAEKLHQLGALMRSAQLVGALRRAQQLSHTYVTERVQFGRALAKFQAIQQQLAMLAAELEAASVMSGIAAMEFDQIDPQQVMISIASAKVQAGQAAGMGARIVHQVHGAMGFTQEYPLHHATRRLWSWRDEYGSETHWALRLGDGAIDAGGERLWAMLTAS